MPDLEGIIQAVKDLVAKSENIVFFGGAGVSTASGIPDFRSATGLYNQRTGNQYPPETMLSYSFFRARPQEFFDYHLNNLVARDAKPNPAHFALAQLEQQGKLSAVITQNIDGLHQLAGSKRVIELHGNTFRFHCMRCQHPYSLQEVDALGGRYLCQSCGGQIRPDVVLYEEALDGSVLRAAISAIRGADMLIVGGTSLVVYPAAGLIDYYQGSRLVLINHDPTPYDNQADYLLHGNIAEILPQLTL